MTDTTVMLTVLLTQHGKSLLQVRQREVKERTAWGTVRDEVLYISSYLVAIEMSVFMSFVLCCAML